MELVEVTPILSPRANLQRTLTATFSKPRVNIMEQRSHTAAGDLKEGLRSRVSFHLSDTLGLAAEHVGGPHGGYVLRLQRDHLTRSIILERLAGRVEGGNGCGIAAVNPREGLAPLHGCRHDGVSFSRTARLRERLLELRDSRMAPRDGHRLVPGLERLDHALATHGDAQGARDVHHAVPRVAPQLEPAGVP